MIEEKITRMTKNGRTLTGCPMDGQAAARVRNRYIGAILDQLKSGAFTNVTQTREMQRRRSMLRFGIQQILREEDDEGELIRERYAAIPFPADRSAER